MVVQTMGDVTIENVNAYGTLNLGSGNNSGVYIIYAGAGDAAEIKFVNCYNEVQIFSTSYNGGFIGYLYNGTEELQDTVVFENCEFAGHIEGSLVGAFFAQVNYSASAKLVFNNTKVTGSVVGTSVADAIAGYRSSTTSDYSNEPTVLEGSLNQLKSYKFADLAKWNEDKVLVLNAAAEEVAYVKVQVNVYASLENGSSLQAIAEKYDLTDAEVITKFINAGVENKTGVADGNASFYIGETAYIFNASNSTKLSDVISVGAKPTITIFCYNADGVLLGATEGVVLPA